MISIKPIKAAVAIVAACASVLPAQAQDAGALVEALVKKGILTDQEAEEVRADMTRDFAQTNAGKINLGSSITELKLYGDFRYRWQYDDRHPQVDNNTNNSQRSRHRFRLRLNADVSLTDNFNAGFALESGQASDSGNQTFENGFDDYQIFISKAFLGWKAAEWFSLTVGKFKNPFYTTDLVWDSDINPQGAMQSIAFHKMPIFGGAGGPTGDSKGVMDPSPVRSSPNWELTLVAGQFIFDDNGEFNVDSDLSTDAYLFVEQLIATYKFNSDTSVTIAPGFMTYTAADLSGLTNENAFTDAGDITAPIPVSQTTTTRRDRTVVNYDATTGAITGGRVETRESVSTQRSQPTVTANGVSTVDRQTNATDRVISRRVLSVAQARAFANENGLSLGLGGGQGATGGAPSATVDGDSVVVSTTAANRNRYGAVSGETRQLHILTAPGDFSFKLAGLKSKLYWDFAYNLGGRERFEDIYQLYYGGAVGEPRTSYNTRDGLAWLVGFQIGETKKKGDWQANFNYRETGIASVDPNLNDSDFALSELNTRGFKLSLAYAVSDAVVFNVTGMMAWNLNENLIGGRATNAPAIAQDNATNVLQVDLNVKF